MTTFQYLKSKDQTNKKSRVNIHIKQIQQQPLQESHSIVAAIVIADNLDQEAQNDPQENGTQSVDVPSPAKNNNSTSNKITKEDIDNLQGIGSSMEHDEGLRSGQDGRLSSSIGFFSSFKACKPKFDNQVMNLSHEQNLDSTTKLQEHVPAGGTNISYNTQVYLKSTDAKNVRENSIVSFSKNN